MPQPSFTVFDTPIGPCAIAWGPRGVVGSQLPERDEAATRARIGRRLPDAIESAPPEHVQHVVDAVLALLRGGQRDLAHVALDMTDVAPFERRVYEITRGIAPGRTLSYGEVARLLGDPGAARAVGQALGRNPFAPIVPCHRVLAAGGRIGGFSARGGATAKLRLLAIEGARAGGEPDLFDAPAGP